MLSTLPLQFGIPGGPELLVILLIAVLLFGANKIPKLARSTGEAMGEFQKGREEVEQELQDMREGPTQGDTELESGEEPTVETATAEEAAAEANTTAAVDEGEPEAESQDEDEDNDEDEHGSDEDFEIADAEPNEKTN